MKDVKVSDTHNYALVGHAGDGKTSLGEAILHAVGATHELGSVEAGTSVLNHTPEEKERHTTQTSSVYAYDAGGKHFTLVDTPGDSNFQAEGQILLQRLDGAVLVASAVEGAKVGTDRMFGALMVVRCLHLNSFQASTSAGRSMLGVLGSRCVMSPCFRPRETSHTLSVL